MVSDRLLLTGEITAIVSGELASKIYLTISDKDWTPASEHININPLTHQFFLSFSEEAFDRLWFDGSLLVSAWFIANIVSSGGVLGLMPRNSGAVYDQVVFALLIHRAAIAAMTNRIYVCMHACIADHIVAHRNSQHSASCDICLVPSSQQKRQ